MWDQNISKKTEKMQLPKRIIGDKLPENVEGKKYQGKY